jgi:hypothetical protein
LISGGVFLLASIFSNAAKNRNLHVKTKKEQIMIFYYCIPSLADDPCDL